MDNQNLITSDSDSSNEKKAYHTPQVRQYGSITELVQANPHIGPDGETTWADCTVS